MIVLSGVFTSVRPAYSVVVLPEPVGPGDEDRAVRGVQGVVEALAVVRRPCRARRGPSRPLSLSRMRITIDSPRTTGSVATRRSTWRPSTDSPMRPSCGTRRSAMSRLAMIFTREIRPGHELARHGRGVHHDAVDAVAHAHVAGARLEVDVGGAAAHGVGDHRVDELDDRRLVGLVAQLDHLGGARVGLLLELLDRVAEARQLADQRVDVLGRGDRAAHLVAGRHRDVVEREHVGRVGGRDEQRSARRGRRSGSSGSGAPCRRRSGWRRPGRPRRS